MIAIKPRLLMWLVAFALLPLMLSCSGHEEPTVDALRSQLAGNHCRFDFPYGRSCELRDEGFWQWFLREPHHCDEAAVLCLGEIGTQAAHETLLKVLENKADIETCDGVYAVRSGAVKILGASGYKPAIAALEKHLASEPVESYSSGASGCSADPEPVEVIIEALENLKR